MLNYITFLARAFHIVYILLLHLPLFLLLQRSTGQVAQISGSFALLSILKLALSIRKRNPRLSIYLAGKCCFH